MSTGAETNSVANGVGGKSVADGMVDADRQRVLRARHEAQQLSMLAPPTPEEMARAHSELRAAGVDDPRPLQVLDRARGGRRQGSRNKRTDEFARWILSFGQHPARTLMEIQSSSPEVLIERSMALDPSKRRLTYGEAQALRVRAADILMPYLESKKPVLVDASIDGDFNLLIPGLNINEADARKAAEGTFMLEAEWLDLDGEADHAG